MITNECLDAVLPVVADSWEKLRGCDVYRLLSSIYYETLKGLYDAGKIVTGKRPDLHQEVTDAVKEIHEEMSN